MRRIFIIGLAALGLAALAGCGKKEQQASTPEVEVRAELPASAGLDGLPGEVYELYGKSAIKWEPWTKESLGLAEETGRLVLAFVVWPNHPSSGMVMEMLEGSPEVAAKVNSTYVPVLIDGNQCREMALLSAWLCVEVKAPLRFPLAIWMTPAGNPVAWIPLTETNPNQPGEIFMQSHLMISQMWSEGASYVIKNGSTDHQSRKNRMIDGFAEVKFSGDPATDSAKALRQVVSLYDSYSRSLDKVGGLLPTTVLDLLTLGARSKGLPEDLRESAEETLGLLLDDILNSAMFDPLDGGVFSSRQGASWALPGFYRDCETQARAVVSLLDAYEVTGNKLALKRARDTFAYIIKTYKTKDGLFALGSYPVTRAGDWLWTMEDLKTALNEKELKVWVASSGMREMGNLPFEVDPSRKFFRENSLAETMDPEAVAEKEGLTVDNVEALLESGREKLLEARNGRIGELPGAREAHAGATFRMISVYANMFRITGETAYRDLATETLAKARDHFAEGSMLNTYKSGAPKNLARARALVYALAMEAALDVASVTGEPRWRIWANDLSKTVDESFARNGVILECSPEMNLVDLPLSDREMVFGESTAGLLAIARTRLAQMGGGGGEETSPVPSELPEAAVHAPITYSDTIQASLIEEYGERLVYGEDVSPEMKQAILRSPFKGAAARFSGDASTLGGKVRLTTKGGIERIFTKPGELLGRAE